MANKDLRNWIKAVEAAGEFKVIKGAEIKEEIGGIVDLFQRQMGNPASKPLGLEKPDRHTGTTQWR